MKIRTSLLFLLAAATVHSDPKLNWGSDWGFGGSGQVVYTNGAAVPNGSDWLVELVSIGDDAVLHSITNGFWNADGEFYAPVTPDAAAWNGKSVKSLIYNASSKTEASLFAEFSLTTNLSWATDPIPSLPVNYNAGAVGSNDWQPIPATLRYKFWLESYNISNTNLAFDSDSDGLFNLAEYAHGGDPTNGADGSVYSPKFSPASDVGFAGFEYVYNRRCDYQERGLEYWLELTDDLVTGSWSTNGATVSGTASGDDDFETVTNRISSATNANLFIRLRLELSD